MIAFEIDSVLYAVGERITEEEREMISGGVSDEVAMLGAWRRDAQLNEGSAADESDWNSSYGVQWS